MRITKQGGLFMKKLTLAFLLLFAQVAMGATVAIIDSGTDMNHEAIIPYVWTNMGETPNNGLDDEGNGYIDDVYGWNFAENNYLVIDYQYLGTLTPEIRKFFEIQAKLMKGTATTAEKDWLKSKLQDQEFVRKLMVYANFMHGTHVAGIASRDSIDAKILAIKLIPTEIKLPFAHIMEKLKKENKTDFADFLFKQALNLLAGQQVKLLVDVGSYVNGHRADIANGSFGTGYNQAKEIVRALYILNNFGTEPTEEQLKEFTVYFLNCLVTHSKGMVDASPNTLFVFAAGNDGTSNDEFPVSPANIEANNAISVAATFDNNSLAVFSNFGKDTVDVAAPGVAIESSVPGDKYLEVSGTSQAAPYVTNVASRIKDTNPGLFPMQIKKILMGTVDKKDFLKGKIRTSGVVNPARAVRAAELSRSMPVNLAISRARREVEDAFVDKYFMLPVDRENKRFVLPLPGQIRL